MATISNLTLTILRDVANAQITAQWDVIWSAFDQATDLDYRETFALIGEDTLGDDPISIGLQPLVTLSSGQQASTHRTKNLTLAFSALDEDPAAGADDEIRAVVTYEPLLPVTTTRESSTVVVSA